MLERTSRVLSGDDLTPLVQEIHLLEVVKEAAVAVRDVNAELAVVPISEFKQGIHEFLRQAETGRAFLVTRRNKATVLVMRIPRGLPPRLHLDDAGIELLLDVLRRELNRFAIRQRGIAGGVDPETSEWAGLSDELLHRKVQKVRERLRREGR